MNPHEILRRFPGASKSTLRANASDYGNGKPEVSDHLDSVRNPKPQHDSPPALEDVAKRKAELLQNRERRVIVRITGYRVAPLDPDNFAGSTKDLIDALRAARLIEGDEFWQIVLETDQVKVETKAEQGTEVVIIYP